MSGFERRMLKNPCFFLTIFRLLVWKVLSWPHPVAMLGDAYDLGISIYGSTLKKMNLMRFVSFYVRGKNVKQMGIKKFSYTEASATNTPNR